MAQDSRRILILASRNDVVLRHGGWSWRRNRRDQSIEDRSSASGGDCDVRGRLGCHFTLGSSRSTSRNVGNSFIHRSATATVPMPPNNTAGTVPNRAAVTPLSKPPS